MGRPAKKQTTKSVVEAKSDKVEVKPLPKSGDVWIVATGKSASMKKGNKYFVSAVLAQNLINKGFAELK